MADTTFTDNETIISAEWLNDINNHAYITYPAHIADYNAHVIAYAAHVADTANPHAVTKTQVGLSAVTNDAQLAIANNLSDVASAATARTNLGVAIGTDVQAQDATLQSIAALGTAADKMAYTTGVDVWAETPITSYARTLLDDTNAGDARTTLDVYSTAEVDSLAGANAYSDAMTKLVHPDQSKGLQELQKQGVYPVSFNQQWGGMGYGGLPDGSMGEVTTGLIKDDGAFNQFADNVARTYRAQSFKVSQATDLSSVWLKIYKVGNPTNNLEVYIYSEAAGDPSTVITNGAAITQSGKLHTNNTDGEWVKFTFATNPTLAANTTYFIVMKSSGAVDASNYWVCKGTNSDADYPNGTGEIGDGTPTWTNQTVSINFLVVPATTILSTGLTGFDGAIHCYQGTPLDQSGAFYFANDDLNNKRGTIHYAGTGFTKDKTFHDSGLGTDNNRIVIRTNVTTGYAQVDLYENDGTKHTVTGATDISTGNHIISVGYRAEGDGSDYLNLYVDGASEGTPITAATITLDPQFVSQGHTTIGGGFGLAPTWTLDASDGSVLPSNAANDTFTFTGTGTEANCFAAEGDYWAQNGAGYAATDTGYYSKTTTFVNATGLVAVWSNEVSNSTNGVANDEAAVVIHDGSKVIKVFHHEYFLELNDGATIGYVQIDNTKQNHFLLSATGSDFYLYANGVLIFDGTGLYDAASASNSAGFGDYSATSGDTATVKWYYFKTYEGAYLPEYTSAQISEFAHWNDDKSALLSTIYNAGSIQSVKTLTGMNENYIKAVEYSSQVNGITSAPSTTSTTPVPLDDMSIFAFGKKINCNMQCTLYQSVAGGYSARISIDGVLKEYEKGADSAEPANYDSRITVMTNRKLHNGLHFIQGKYNANSGTASCITTVRVLYVEAE